MRNGRTRYNHLRDLAFRSTHHLEFRDGNNERFHWPLFLTYKYKLTPLQQILQIRADQLQDHFLNVQNLYSSQCKCVGMVHRHDRRTCCITNLPMCSRCGTPTEPLLTRDELRFHAVDVLRTKSLSSCCKHVHRPPCYSCINCRLFWDETGKQRNCLVSEPIICDRVCSVICPRVHPPLFKDGQNADEEIHSQVRYQHTSSSLFTNALAGRTDDKRLLWEHVYDVRQPIFYICELHVHRHRSSKIENCYISVDRCCDNAIDVRDYTKSFSIIAPAELSTLKERPKRKSQNTRERFTTSKEKEQTITYTIFDPSIWREQSSNHFFSLIRALVTGKEHRIVADRYHRFTQSNFKINNFNRYCSGKESMSRTCVTGFETFGAYQTSVISCTQERDCILMPQALYDRLEEMGFDMSVGSVKRDPSLTPGCMFLLRVLRNADPTIQTLVIPCSLARPLHQDQDGDKNTVYLRLKKSPIGGYNYESTFIYQASTLEMRLAMERTVTLIAEPRYSISETNLIVMERYKDTLTSQYPEYFSRVIGKSPMFMAEAACGYLREEYIPFERGLRLHNSDPGNNTYVTADNLINLHSDPDRRLLSIVESYAKGDVSHLDAMMANVRKVTPLTEQKDDMVAMVNKYTLSNKQLARDGRKTFTVICAAQDLICFMGSLFLNKRHYADYGTRFSSAGCLMFNNASLELALEDLISNAETYGVKNEGGGGYIDKAV